MGIKKYIDAANTLYADGVGEILYKFADDFCRIAFDGEINAEMAIILTTAMSPYNKKAGWYCPHSDVIELVRYHCERNKSGITPKDPKDLKMTLAHELCHKYQFKILGGKTGPRGPHRCKSWYESITTASPYVCGYDIEGLCSPLTSKRVDGKVKKFTNPDSLTEVELTHWPRSILKLAKKKDPRLKGRKVGNGLV